MQPRSTGYLYDNAVTSIWLSEAICLITQCDPTASVSIVLVLCLLSVNTAVLSGMFHTDFQQNMNYQKLIFASLAAICCFLESQFDQPCQFCANPTVGTAAALLQFSLDYFVQM